MECLIPNLFIFNYGMIGMIETAMTVDIFEVKDCVVTGKGGEGKSVYYSY